MKMKDTIKDKVLRIGLIVAVLAVFMLVTIMYCKSLVNNPIDASAYNTDRSVITSILGVDPGDISVTTIKNLAADVEKKYTGRDGDNKVTTKVNSYTTYLYGDSNYKVAFDVSVQLKKKDKVKETSTFTVYAYGSGESLNINGGMLQDFFDMYIKDNEEAYTEGDAGPSEEEIRAEEEEYQRQLDEEAKAPEDDTAYQEWLDGISEEDKRAIEEYKESIERDMEENPEMYMPPVKELEIE